MRKSASVISKNLDFVCARSSSVQRDVRLSIPFAGSAEEAAQETRMGMLQNPIRNTQWKAVLFQNALYHRKWTTGIGNLN
jgi:hypothetical protein